MQKFLLFDGNAILHRAFHALPPLTTKKGEPINAVYGMTSMMLKLVQEFRPTYLAYAFDTKEPTFRNQLSQEYQAQRPEVDDSLISQFEKARITLNAFGIPFFEKIGYEADDIIGTISKIVKDCEVIIVTGDRDILQLVSGNVKVFMPQGGLANGKLFAREDVLTKMGVNPEEIIAYKALVGDASDNYKGVPGIGPKTAIKLIQEYKNLSNILASLDKLQPKLREKFEKNKESAILSEKLATIVRDIPLPEFVLDDCKKWRFDADLGVSLFEEYGFKTLTKRVKEVAKQFVSENQVNLFS